MKKLLLTTIATTALALAGLAGTYVTPIHAEQNDKCTFSKPGDELEQPEIDLLYECIKDRIQKGYAKADHPIGANYLQWKVTQTGIAPVGGVHGNRFLRTFANDIAFDEYVKYRDEGGFSMPVGSILAKESWKLTKDGKPQPGPLLIMTKLKAGEASEFGDWLYSGVSPGSGKEFKVSQKFCHDCHGAYEDQDSMGYPAEEVRIKAKAE